jgi:mono/diheme cytochrome c family protein
VGFGLQATGFRPPVLRPSCAALAGGLVAWLVASGCAPRDPAAEHAALVRRGHDVFFTRCAPCHGPQGDWPMVKRLKGRSAGDFYTLFDHLPSVNPIMPPFDAPDDDRRAVAAYLASLTATSWDATTTSPAGPPHGPATGGTAP